MNAFQRSQTPRSFGKHSDLPGVSFLLPYWDEGTEHAGGPMDSGRGGCGAGWDGTDLSSARQEVLEQMKGLSHPKEAQPCSEAGRFLTPSVQAWPPQGWLSPGLPTWARPPEGCQPAFQPLADEFNKPSFNVSDVFCLSCTKPKVGTGGLHWVSWLH